MMCMFVYSCCLSSGVVELLWSTSHLLTITLSSHSIHLKLNLTQLSSDQCKPQVQRLIFDLWTQLDTTRSQLTGIYNYSEFIFHHVMLNIWFRMS